MILPYELFTCYHIAISLLQESLYDNQPNTWNQHPRENPNDTPDPMATSSHVGPLETTSDITSHVEEVDMKEFKRQEDEHGIFTDGFMCM